MQGTMQGPGQPADVSSNQDPGQEGEDGDEVRVDGQGPGGQSEGVDP